MVVRVRLSDLCGGFFWVVSCAFVFWDGIEFCCFGFKLLFLAYLLFVSVFDYIKVFVVCKRFI